MARKSKGAALVELPEKPSPGVLKKARKGSDSDVSPAEKPVSLHPLEFEKAVRGLLKTSSSAKLGLQEKEE